VKIDPEYFIKHLRQEPGGIRYDEKTRSFSIIPKYQIRNKEGKQVLINQVLTLMLRSQTIHSESASWD